MANREIAVHVAGGRASEEMFADLPPVDFLSVKLDQVATNLAALMATAGLTRSAIAEKCNWHKSRVSYVLSGEDNLTLKTIMEFAGAVGYDFDVHFRKFDELPARQPWEHGVTESLGLFPVQGNQSVMINMQTKHEVKADLDNGSGAPRYFSFVPVFDQSTMIPSLPGASTSTLQLVSSSLIANEVEYEYTHARTEKLRRFD